MGGDTRFRRVISIPFCRIFGDKIAQLMCIMQIYATRDDGRAQSFCRQIPAQDQPLPGLALRPSVAFTRNGRESCVLLSTEEYRRLMRRDRQVFRTEDRTEEEIELIAKSEAPPRATSTTTMN